MTTGFADNSSIASSRLERFLVNGKGADVDKVAEQDEDLSE